MLLCSGLRLPLRRYSEETASRDRQLTDRIADAGNQLANIATDLVLVAVEQAQSIRGLYESSSEVTREEFAHFASVMGTAVSNRMVFAPRVSRRPT